MIFGCGLRYRGVINVFPHVEDAADRQVKSSPDTNLGPLEHSRWYTPLGETVFVEFDSLGSVWNEVDNPIDANIRNLDLFQFRD